MPENRDSRITDAMVDAAARALHAQLGGYRHLEPASFDELEAFDKAVWADDARVVLDAAARAEVANIPIRSLAPPGPEAFNAPMRLLVVPGDNAVLESYPQWWCRACGNRYAEHVDVDLCSCGGELQAVTLQLVAREA